MHCLSTPNIFKNSIKLHDELLDKLKGLATTLCYTSICNLGGIEKAQNIVCLFLETDVPLGIFLSGVIKGYNNKNNFLTHLKQLLSGLTAGWMQFHV